MLGLSATPKRKDGLSKVFEWYLGPYVYINKSKVETRPIESIMINYTNHHSDYCKEETTNYGKTCIPRMLTNICNFQRRTCLIVDLIKNIYKDNNRNILVLSGRIEHLRDISKLLLSENISDVGFYIGGMKEGQLKESENKRIILASYAMSSEGMDIPSLNTLILASPMSDIEQSVGRILRKEHESLIPQVYDIMDNFSVFINQSIKRKRFYKSKKYRLNNSIVNDNNDYSRILLLERALDIKPVENIKKNTKKKSTKCLIDDDD